MKKWLAILSTMILVPFTIPSFPVTAADNDWEHYAAMDDYAVYCEYCQWKGIEPAEKLPARRDLPDHDHFYWNGYAMFDNIHVDLDVVDLDGDDKFTAEDERAHRVDASYYGFPSNWITEKWQPFGYRDNAPLLVIASGGVVVFKFNERADETLSIRSNSVNYYRIKLTLLHSEFAKEHPIREVLTLYPLESSVPRLGDTNANDEIEILDVILVNKALLGGVTLTDEQEHAADVDQNGVIDTTDALMLLKEVVKITQEFEMP